MLKQYIEYTIEEYSIIITSKQYLQNKKNIFNDTKFDLIIFDETHFGGTTDISIDILHEYSNTDTILLYLTATYRKPEEKFSISNIIIWDLEDENRCKDMYVDYEKNYKIMKEKWGELLDIVLLDFKNRCYHRTDILKPYLNYPKMQELSCIMDEERYNEIKKRY